MDGGSYHLLILLQVGDVTVRGPTPFKFNHALNKEDNFKDLVKQTWRPFDPDVGISPMDYFVSNLKSLKIVVVGWETKKKGIVRRKCWMWKKKIVRCSLRMHLEFS